MTKQISYIICVDDDREFLKSLEAVLPKRVNSLIEDSDNISYRFEFFDNPEEAIAVSKEIYEEGEDIAMIIADQRMPKIKGIALLEKIKKFTPQTIRVLLTGHAGLESAIEAINYNTLDKYLVKPISDINDFTVTIKTLLEKYLMRKKIYIQNQIIHQSLNYLTNLNKIMSLDSTLDYMGNFIKETIKTDQIGLFILEDNFLNLKKSFGFSANLEGKLQISEASPLINKIFKCESVIEVADFSEKFNSVDNALDISKIFVSDNALFTKLTISNKPIGILLLIRKDQTNFTDIEKHSLSYISSSGAIAINNQQNKILIEQTYIEIIKTLATALEENDPYTKGHSIRVSSYAKMIAQEMGFDKNFIKDIDTAGILHDIGKIGISDSIINKKGKLTDEEYRIIKYHPVKSEAITKHIKFLKDITPIIRFHHEQFDGKGYPDRIKGQDIPIGARILSVADTFDAMTSCRPYRNALKMEDAIAELKRVSGTQLDPDCVEAFLKICNPVKL